MSISWKSFFVWKFYLFAAGFTDKPSVMICDLKWQSLLYDDRSETYAFIKYKITLWLFTRGSPFALQDSTPDSPPLQGSTPK